MAGETTAFRTHNQSRGVHILVLHEELAHVLTPQRLLGDKLGEGPVRLAVLAGHYGGEVGPAGVQVERLLGSYPGSWNFNDIDSLTECDETIDFFEIFCIVFLEGN